MVDSIPVEDNDKLLIFELEYLVQEGTERPVTARGFGTASNSWELLKTLKTVDDATVFWHDDFEKSAMTKDEVKNIRGTAAQKIYERFNGTDGSGGGCSSSSGGGDFINYVKRYAWPERTVRTDKKPDYEKAIEKAKSENRFTGGTCYGGGVDCGAFVTTILNDSGFDKNYNYGGESGKAGPTGVQRAWAETNWQTLGNGSSINVADLKPGDVAHSPGHTFVFVGNIEGFDSNIASASLCEYAPKAGGESLTSPSVTWFRKK